MAKSRGLAALAPNGLKSQGYTVSNYPRDNLTPGMRGIMDSLAANPATANIGVKSGYRSPAKNAKAGGAKRSQHLTGNAVDLDISGLSAAQKKEALDTAIAAGAKGIGVYASGNSLHVDPRATPTVWGQLANAYKGMTKKQFDMLPDWARPAIDGLFGGFNPQPNASLPATMQAPQFREQAMFTPPARPTTINPPSRFPSVPVGQVTRSPLDAIPASLNAAPVGRVERAPLGPVGQFSQPARSLQHPTSVAPPSRIAAAPVSPVTRGPALAPAAPSVQKQGLVDAYGQYAATRTAAEQTAKLAEQYAQYQKMPGAIVPAKPLAHPISVPPAPVNVPPAPVLAPLMAPPAVVKDYAVGGVPQAPAAPRATAYDVYSGLADTALDNTGKNTVSRDAFGNTTVTNQHGATTAMTPGGYQSAYGGIPGGSLPSLPGIKGPDMGKFGQAVKGALPGIGGGLLGTAVAGPLGGMIGAALAKAVTQPGGLLSGVKSFDTDYFGTLNAARPQAGGAFPSAPRAAPGTSSGFRSSGERSAAYSRSPGAAANIDAGRTGLY